MKSLLVYLLIISNLSVMAAEEFMHQYGRQSDLTKKEIELIISEAKKGNSMAQAKYAQLNLHGMSGIKQDKKKALYWYEKSVEQNNPEAQHELGVMYCVGAGVLKDPNKCLKLIKKAADQNYGMAQYALAETYCFGFKDYVNKDLKQCAKYAKKAFENGFGDQKLWNKFELWKY